MTNSENQNPKEAQMTKSEMSAGEVANSLRSEFFRVRHSSFGFLSSFVIRHSSF